MRRMGRGVTLRKKRSIFVIGTTGLVSLVMTVIIMLMCYLWMDSRCGAISREISRCEKELKDVTAELERTRTRWEEMKVPGKLEEKLVRFGLNMKYARSDQVVRMNADGRPAPGQIAVARARQRTALGTVARAVGVDARSSQARTPTKRR